MRLLALLWSGNGRAQRFALMCAVGLALVSPRALAAAAMCDPSGASVVAPIPVLPNATGNLTAPKNCDESNHDWIDASHAGRRTPMGTRGVDAPPRILPTAVSFPIRKGILLPRPDSDRLPVHPGYAAPVYRPPRA